MLEPAGGKGASSRRMTRIGGRRLTFSFPRFFPRLSPGATQERRHGEGIKDMPFFFPLFFFPPFSFPFSLPTMNAADAIFHKILWAEPLFSFLSPVYTRTVPRNASLHGNSQHSRTASFFLFSPLFLFSPSPPLFLNAKPIAWQA